jgi:hypothetical protein
VVAFQALISGACNRLETALKLRNDNYNSNGLKHSTEKIRLIPLSSCHILPLQLTSIVRSHSSTLRCMIIEAAIHNLMRGLLRIVTMFI